jgi:hypothetical protein
MAYSTYPGAASGQSAGGQYAGFNGGATWVDGVSTQIAFVPLTSGTGSAQIPVGVTEQRDAVPIQGSIRYNTTTGRLEFYSGTIWAAAAGAGGGDGDFFVFENDIQVDVDYTLTAGKNGMSAGPITIASGVTVTVPVGSTYTIV